MAVKFSAFTAKTTAEASNVTEIVGYLSTGNENIRIAPSAFDTTYAFTTVTNSGTPTNVDFIATATKGTQASTTETVVFAAGSNVTLTAGTREITIASTDTNTTYTVDVPTATTNINLAGSDGSNDAITLSQGTDISLTRISASEIQIGSTATGDTYTLQAGTKAGSSVPLQLDAATGSDSTVNLTEGTGITLTQTSATEITIDGTASSTRLVVTKTGNNSTDIFTDITTGLTLPVSNSNFYIDVYISGVYQQKSTYTYSTATNGTVTFTTAPPVTASNGIEFVTTV